MHHCIISTRADALCRPTSSNLWATRKPGNGCTKNSTNSNTPSNPVGQVLILDVILNVAKYGGENRFAQGSDWAHQFVRCVARVLDRPSIRIDVPGFVVG